MRCLLRCKINSRSKFTRIAHSDYEPIIFVTSGEHARRITNTRKRRMVEEEEREKGSS